MVAEDTAALWTETGTGLHAGADLVGAEFDVPGRGVIRVTRTTDEHPQEVIVADGDGSEFRAAIDQVRALVERKRAAHDARLASTGDPAGEDDQGSAEAASIAGAAVVEEDRAGSPIVSAPVVTATAQEVRSGTDPSQRLAAVRADYLRLKDTHPDAVIVFEACDGYECYDADAQLVAEAMGATLAAVKYPGSGYGFRATITLPDIDVIAARGHGVIVAQTTDEGETSLKRVAPPGPPDLALDDGGRAEPSSPIGAGEPARALHWEPEEELTDAGEVETTSIPAAGDAVGTPDDQEADSDARAGDDAEGAEPERVQEMVDTATAPSAGAASAPVVERGRLFLGGGGAAPPHADGTISVEPRVRAAVGPHKKTGDAVPGDVIIASLTLGAEAAMGDLSALGALVAGLIGTRQTRKEQAAAHARAEKTQQAEKKKEEKKKTTETRKTADKLNSLKAAANRVATPVVVPSPGAAAATPGAAAPVTPLAATLAGTMPPSSDATGTAVALPERGAAPVATPPAKVTAASAQAAVAALAKTDGDEVKAPVKKKNEAPAAQMDLLALIEL